MNYLHYSDVLKSEYPVVFLVAAIHRDHIKASYITPYSIDPELVLVLDLAFSQTKKKTPMKEMRQYLDEEIVHVLENAKAKIVVVNDAEYFKALTKLPKADANIGYAVPSTCGGYEVFYVPNYKAKFYDPVKVGAKIDSGMWAVKDKLLGQYKPPGHGVIHYAQYPDNDADIQQALDALLAMDCPLTIDIEGFSLKHYDCGIGSISLAWNEHEGIAFPVDYVPIPGATEAPFGTNVRNERRRLMLRKFFAAMKHKIIFHNIAFDVYVLIYQLYMDHLLDQVGLLEGLHTLLNKWDCTKLIAYLATNSCAGNKLGLKDQAQTFAGNYAVEDVKDITRIPLAKLLEYNLVDSLSTWFVYKKHWSTLDTDNQRQIYDTLFKPATVDIIQMQLSGMPVYMPRVIEVKAILEADEQKALVAIRNSPMVQKYTYKLNEQWVLARNAALKVKRVTLADAKEVFNPNSDQQLQQLLYRDLGLPVLAVTKSKQPSTSGKTLKALVFHTADPVVKELLKALQDLKSVSKILTSFIPAMLNAQLANDGWHYLFGNYNLGGTVSGRLSSSNPNMQNLPANSKYAKLIKSCFQAPPGWLFLGLDFASLEDRISAVTTQDPNKRKVYTDGYDGHSLRAFSYFGHLMPDIIDTVESINSIQMKYDSLRYDSKAPTFALTYQGTFSTLMKNCGFDEEKSKMIEARYHQLYVVSDQWVASKLQQATKDGYITAAFGLRVRTPLLAQVILGNSRTPREAQAEGRTAGNALGQSWCMLNSRAGTEFNGGVRKSVYANDIKPAAQIHDAQYFLVRDHIEVVLYVNEHLVKAVEWQDHPDIADPDVKLGGDLSIFWPNWAVEMGIKNGASNEEIFEAVETHALWVADGCPKL